MTLTLKVTAMAGDNLADVAKEIAVLAIRLDIHVECDFNGVVLIMPPHGSWPKMVAEYETEIRKNGLQTRMAWG